MEKDDHNCHPLAAPDAGAAAAAVAVSADTHLDDFLLQCMVPGCAVPFDSNSWGLPEQMSVAKFGVAQVPKKSTPAALACAGDDNPGLPTEVAVGGDGGSSPVAAQAEAVTHSCCDPSNSNRPYILSCGHAVCGGCASACVANKGSCAFPHCTAKVTVPDLPDAGLMQLAATVRAESLATAIPPHCDDEIGIMIPRVVCDACLDDDPKNAVSRCVDCNLMLCTSHVSRHQQRCATHTVEPLGADPGSARSAFTGRDSVGAVASAAAASIVCPLHPVHPLDKYCRACSVTVCERCIHLFHAQHGDITSAIAPTAFAVKQLQELRTGLVAVAAAVPTHCEALQTVLGSLASKKPAILERIDSVEEELLAAVTAHCAKLRKDCHGTCDERAKRLNAQRDGFLVNAAQCSAYDQVVEAAINCGNALRLGDATTTLQRGVQLATCNRLEATLPCVSDFLDVDVSVPAVIVDALANLAVLRKARLLAISHSVIITMVIYCVIIACGVSH